MWGKSLVLAKDRTRPTRRYTKLEKVHSFKHKRAGIKKKQKQAPWPEFESEYGPSDRRLSANLVPAFSDREASRSQRGGSPTAVI
jgi:hypothetical protein